jgi:hypothetical protein
MIGGEDFVAASEGEGAENSIYPGSGVGNESEVARFSADELGESSPGFVEKRLELANHKGHGFALEPAAQSVLIFQDWLGTGAEGAVVQERDGGVEPPEVAAGGRFLE